MAMSYEIQQYKNQVAVTDARLVDTISANIRLYSDTSNKKEFRIRAVYDTASILEHVCISLTGEDPTTKIMRAGFHRILEKCMRAHIDDRNIQNFTDELGFLSVIRESL